MPTKRYQFKYPYSKFWLIFWMLVFLPIGFILLTRLEYTSSTHTTRWDYEGDRGWLYFWAILFFPVALLLLLFKGSLIVTSRET